MDSAPAWSQRHGVMILTPGYIVESSEKLKNNSNHQLQRSQPWDPGWGWAQVLFQGLQVILMCSQSRASLPNRTSREFKAMCSVFTTTEPPEMRYNTLRLGFHAQRFRIIGLRTFKISLGDCNVQPRWRTAGWKTFMSFLSDFIQSDVVGSTRYWIKRLN